jgi:hypothetical protein
LFLHLWHCKVLERKNLQKHPPKAHFSPCQGGEPVDGLITNQMPLLTTLAFARGKKEMRQTAWPSALCMGRGRLIRASARSDGGPQTTLQSDGHGHPQRRFGRAADWTVGLDNLNSHTFDGGHARPSSSCEQQIADGGL